MEKSAETDSCSQKKEPKYEVGQKLICIGMPDEDYQFDGGNFDYENEYTILKTYEIFEEELWYDMRSKQHTQEMGFRVTSNSFYYNQNMTWWFSERELNEFFLLVTYKDPDELSSDEDKTMGASD